MDELNTLSTQIKVLILPVEIIGPDLKMGYNGQEYHFYVEKLRKHVKA